MTATLHEFPKAGSANGEPRGTGAVAAAPVASSLSPAERVSWAYRWTWRGAWRCRAGDDAGAGYRMMARACMSGLLRFMGPARTADYLMRLAYEAAAPILEGSDNDDGPRAA